MLVLNDLKKEMLDVLIHAFFSLHKPSPGRLKIRERLKAGTTIVCDRYAYSGVAFSASKPGEATAMQQPSGIDVLLVVCVVRAYCLDAVMLL